MKAPVPIYKKIFAETEPYLYLLPALSLLLLFIYYPFFKNTVLSFFTVNRYREIKSFAGLRNYVKILSDEKFLRAVVNTLVYVAATVPAKITGSASL